MRKILLAALVATALGACSPTGTITQLTPQTVVQAVINACKVVPDITDIVALMAANPWLTTATAFAKLVCSALPVSAQPGVARRLTAPVVLNVRGVPVRVMPL